MASLSHILAPAPEAPSTPPAPAFEHVDAKAAMPPPRSIPKLDETAAASPRDDAQDDGGHSSATISTRRNASGSVSSVFSGNKIKHLKKEDGIPLWRKDIQYEFLKLVFDNDQRVFTKYSDSTTGWTFAEIYIDAMAKSSKCSKILKEKLLQDTEGAISMAMVCLLVNVGRMNTTLNFFPEMRAQLRTYHSIPALQAHQDPNAYKQLQDAPRLKSILKGATEDEPQPSTMDEVQAAKKPRTNPVNLIFVMSNYAPKIGETHFNAPREFFDLVVRSSLSSASRARAFLWLVWWYLESDFTYADSQRNPFGKGQFGEGEETSEGMPLKVPTLESLTEDQAALENRDTEEEERFGEVKRKERIAILASEPSPAMTALKRARKEKGLTSARDAAHASDDDGSEAGWHRPAATSAGRPSGLHHETGSEYTRSPSPPANRGFQAVNAAKPPGDMRINNLLNDDAPVEVSPVPVKKGPGRGNWRRNRQKQETVPLAVRGTESSHHVPLLPNTALNFVNDTPRQQIQPATPGTYGYSNGVHLSPQHNLSFQSGANRDHVPTPSYQAQKRSRGVTQHQSALMSHRKQQIDYLLDRRIRKVHARARDDRENEGAVLRAWKRIKLMPPDYDSEEESIKLRKARDRPDKDDDWRTRGRDGFDAADDLDALRRPRVLIAGLATTVVDDPLEVGEHARTLARTLRRASRRLERWQETALPAAAMIRRRQQQMQGLLDSRYARPLPRQQVLGDGDVDGLKEDLYDAPPPSRGQPRQRSGTGRMSDGHADGGGQEEQRSGYDVEEDDGGGELDEEEREMLGDVDVGDESEEDEEDEDEDMGED